MRFDQVEPFFNAVDAKLKAILPTMHSDQAFFDRRHARLQIGDVVDETIKLVINTAQIAQDQTVRFFAHIPASAA